MPSATSVCASQAPPSSDPAGSQSHAAGTSWQLGRVAVGDTGLGATEPGAGTHGRRRWERGYRSAGAGNRRACRDGSGGPWCCAGSHHTRPHWCSRWPGTRPCRSGSAVSARCSRILQGRHPWYPTLACHLQDPKSQHVTQDPMAPHRAGCGRVALTAAGVGAGALSRAPGQLMVEVLAALTVQPLRVVLADTAPVDLGESIWISPKSHPVPRRSVPHLTMPGTDGGAPGAGAHSAAWPWQKQLPRITSSSTA